MRDIAEPLFRFLTKSNLTRPGECYANCCHAVLLEHFPTYVLGLAELPNEQIPVRHAWLEDGMESYDPTLQVSRRHLQAKYEAVRRLTKRDILSVISQNYSAQDYDRIIAGQISFYPPKLNSEGHLVCEL